MFLKNRRIGVFEIFALTAMLFVGCSSEIVSQNPLPPLYSDSNFFLSAIKQHQIPASEERVSGVSVPHHLLAKDLIAEAFSLVSKNHYSLIVLLSPDHFSRGKTFFSTTKRNFDTVFGTVITDQESITELLKNPLVSTNDELFYFEHGIQAELPFLRWYFPDTPVVLLAIRGGKNIEAWDSLTDSLKAILPKDALIIQSTDFSHYLSPLLATKKDEETKKMIISGNAKKIAELSPIQHVDSVAAQYIHMRLQQEFFKAEVLIFANKNSQDYTKEKVSESTSYIVQIWKSIQNASFERK